VPLDLRCDLTAAAPRLRIRVPQRLPHIRDSLSAAQLADLAVSCTDLEVLESWLPPPLLSALALFPRLRSVQLLTAQRFGQGTVWGDDPSAEAEWRSKSVEIVTLNHPAHFDRLLPLLRERFPRLTKVQQLSSFRYNNEVSTLWTQGSGSSSRAA
jgi:hypothetical protein